MDSKIKVAEFISRLEFGGAEAMLLNYTTHFQHPEQFDLHIITCLLYTSDAADE